MYLRVTGACQPRYSGIEARMGDEKVGLHCHLAVVPVLGLSVTVRMEDLAETAYDEAEAASHKSAALISNQMPQAAVSAIQAMQSSLRCQLFTLLRITPVRIDGTYAHCSAEASVALREQWISGYRGGLCT